MQILTQFYSKVKQAFRITGRPRPVPTLPDLPIVWRIAGSRPDWRRVFVLEVTNV